MISFPALRPVSRDREFLRVSEELRDKVVYQYLFLGLSHRLLDKDILNLNPINSRGWTSMGILHHIGLWDEHKNFFSECTVIDAIATLQKQDKHAFKTVILSLLRYSEGLYSDDNIDYFYPNSELPVHEKDVGKSQYRDGVRIAQAFHEIFNPPSSPFYAERGTARPIKVLFNNKVFDAEYRYEGQTEPTRVQQSIRFKKELKEEFAKVFPQPIGQFRIQAGRDLNHFIFSHASTVVDEEELDDTEYAEGKQAFRLHRTRERKPEVVKKAKERFFKKHGRLFCEVCDFNFYQLYGSRGQHFIEGHHTKLVSEMNEGERTKVEDIALLCSNCHRIIHRQPFITVEELRELVKMKRGY